MPFSRKLLVFIGDCTALLLSFYGTLFVRLGGITHATITTNWVPFLFVYLIWIVVLYLFEMYEAREMKVTLFSLPHIFYMLMTQTIFAFLLFYLVPAFGITPKTSLLINILIFGILFTLWRRLIWKLFARTFFTKKIALVGVGSEIDGLKKELQENPHIGYNFFGSFGTMSDLLLHDNHKEVDTVVVSTTLSQKELEKSAQLSYELLDIRKAFQKIFYKIPASLMNEEFAVYLLERHTSRLHAGIMRIVEIVGASIVLILTSPISLFIIIAIKLEDGGPILYKNDRAGKNGSIFYVYKFRSMIQDAETHGAEWAQLNDTRITHTGTIIRKLHIDEIPQMLNILLGDLALVGPRPERPVFVEKLKQEIPFYFLRHMIKPGFTGWAQIKFRYARTVIDSEEKFAYDLYYLKNRTLLMDITIIMKTIQIIFTHAKK